MDSGNRPLWGPAPSGTTWPVGPDQPGPQDAEPPTDSFGIVDPTEQAIVGEPPTVSYPASPATVRVPAQRTGGAPAPRPPSTPPAGRRNLLVAVAAGAVLVVAAVTVLVIHGSTGGPTTTVATGPTYYPSSVVPAPPASYYATPTATTAPPVATALVVIDPSVPADDTATTVVNLLDRYFTAINERDYQSWVTTVVPARTNVSAAQWTEDYRSTTDSGVVVTSLTRTGADSATIGITFTSTQDLAHAPADLRTGQICWTSRWPITQLSSGGRVGSPGKGSTTREAC